MDIHTRYALVKFVAEMPSLQEKMDALNEVIQFCTQQQQMLVNCANTPFVEVVQ